MGNLQELQVVNDSAQHCNTCTQRSPPFGSVALLWRTGGHTSPHPLCQQTCSLPCPRHLPSPSHRPTKPFLHSNRLLSRPNWFLRFPARSPPHAANTSDRRPHETLSSPSYPTPPRQPFPWFSSARQLPRLSPQWIIIWRLTRRVRQSHTTFRRRPTLGRFLPSMAGLRI